MNFDVSHSDDAKEIVDDACDWALTYVGSLAADDGLAWLLTIVRQVFHGRRTHKRPAGTAREVGRVIGTAVHPAVAREQALPHDVGSTMLADWIEALPLAYREVLILRELEDLSYEKIARIVGIPMVTVILRLARARALLEHAPLLQAI